MTQVISISRAKDKQDYSSLDSESPPFPLCCGFVQYLLSSKVSNLGAMGKWTFNCCSAENAMSLIASDEFSQFVMLRQIIRWELTPMRTY